MNVKGTAIKTIPDFVRQNYGQEGYERWLAAMPVQARSLFESKLRISDWYPLVHGVTLPTQAICDVFFSGDLKGAWEAGRYSATVTLRGIYRSFLKIGSPKTNLRRGTQIIRLYYDEAELFSSDGEQNKSAIVKITKFPGINDILEQRIAGWIQRGLELTGTVEPKIEIVASLADGDELTRLEVTWK